VRFPSSETRPASTGVWFLLRVSAKAAHEDRQDAGGLQLVAWVELDAINRRDSTEYQAGEKPATFEK